MFYNINILTPYKLFHCGRRYCICIYTVVLINYGINNAN